MGYRGGSLTDLVPPLERGVRRFARNAVPDVGRELRRRVRRHTPVKQITPAEVLSFGKQGALLKRKGRIPGTLRDSWQVGEVAVRRAGTSEVYSIPVFTHDEVAPHVEWDTLPHLILPRKPGGFLTVPTNDGLVFARVVHHPGTKGVHMMATAMQEVAAEWQRIVSRQWRNETRASRFWREGA